MYQDPINIIFHTSTNGNYFKGDVFILNWLNEFLIFCHIFCIFFTIYLLRIIMGFWYFGKYFQSIGGGKMVYYKYKIKKFYQIFDAFEMLCPYSWRSLIQHYHNAISMSLNSPLGVFWESPTRGYIYICMFVCVFA